MSTASYKRFTDTDVTLTVSQLTHLHLSTCALPVVFVVVVFVAVQPVNNMKPPPAVSCSSLPSCLLSQYIYEVMLDS